MIIHHFNYWLCAFSESMKVELPREGLKLDPRANHPNHVRFSIDYHDEDDGITVTLTRIDDDDFDDWCAPFKMRAYDPQMETVPDFTSTIYVYMGLDDERPPSDTTLVIIHPSVKIIKGMAFQWCLEIRRVIMNENVETIEDNAFSECHSLEAVFLPSSIKEIGKWAFSGCPNLRILSIPPTINIDQNGYKIIYECDTLFRITQIQPYERDENFSMINNDQVNQALIGFNRNLPPLHKVCLNTNVTAQSIRQCIDTHGRAAAYNTDYGDGMTPMHILALNPHATTSTGAILTLFHANMGVVFETYSEGFGEEDDEDEQHSAIGGKTLLDCLSVYDVDSYLSIIEALCRHREACLSYVNSSPTVENLLET